MTDASKDSWITAEIRCVICGHEQISCFPIEAPALECSGCGHMNVAERNRVVEEDRG